MQEYCVLLNNKKSEQLPVENETESSTKLRASALFGRFSKTIKCLAKTPSTRFQIKKPLNVYRIEELNKLGRKTYFQRVYILAKNVDEEKLKEHFPNSKSKFSDLQLPDFRECFQRQVDEIFAICEKNKCTPDHLSGLFIAMGTTYTYLMIEGAEDMIAKFFEQFALLHDRLWNISKVFLVEDKIGETYFNCFYSRRSLAININEKFPPSTSNEWNLMAVQHLKLKEKVKNLMEILSTLFKNVNTIDNSGTSSDIPSDPFCLPAEPFNKLLPEIQRIDLVLNCNKFYRTFKDFSQTYRILQTHQDENAFIWPIQNNYTPLDIFKRSEYDVNLIFGNYDQEENKLNQENDLNLNAPA